MFRLPTHLVAFFLLGAHAIVTASPVIGEGLANESPRSLDSRSDSPFKKLGINCGIYNTASKRDFMSLQSDLVKRATVTIPAGTCNRVECWNTSAIYVCNDTDQDKDLSGKVVNDFAASVGFICCRAAYTQSPGISGQIFSDAGWNVIVAYANCNHDSNADRPSMGPPNDPWGPNGKCENL